MLRGIRPLAIRATGARYIVSHLQQMEMSQPLTEKDRPVTTFTDEFGRPKVHSDMMEKYGRYAKYSNPEFCKVDTSQEVVLNTYPEGTSHGMLQNNWGNDLDNFHAAFGEWDENFFRKNILKPKVPEELEDKPRVLDYALNATIVGLMAMLARYAVVPLWWIGQPRMTLVHTSNIEVELGQLEDKECRTVVWRGKPVYLYKRSQFQMDQLDQTPLSALKHPETDQQRFGTHPEYRKTCVVIAICTHLGCIPLPNEGMYLGFFCPCHGSHYDAGGRIRQGPAPLNLEVPPHRWIDAGTVFLGK